ncbi:MAG: DUF2220 family protein [Chitinispirillales bacterium]|jgi:hypothetical protein|nr:DUF2220 family protein [Chitinispirillales bacterium]
MITPNEIKIKAEKRYFSYLQSVVEGYPFIEIVIEGSKKPNENFSIFQRELTELTNNSKEKKGYGYAIKYQTIKKKNLGTQDIPTQISFQSEADYLKYLRKEKEVERFRENCALILSEFPELKDWLAKYPQKAIENQDKWDDILKVCNYFNSNPNPGLYIRELPIQVHTKFIEKNKTILKELLDILIQEYVNKDEKDFEKRFNLKYAGPLAHFRILDKNVSQKYFSGIDDLSIPVSQFEKLNLPIRKVFVVENKMNVLTFPVIEKTIVIFGSGFGVENLKNTQWLREVELFYWGDLDVQGFEILSQFRSYFPHTKSFLMNTETFERYFEHDKGTDSKITAALNLTKEEQLLYKQLKENNWRLEQEKVPQRYVNEIVTNRLNT